MAGNKQMERLQEIIARLEKGLSQSIGGLQQSAKALTIGGIIPPQPKKDLVRALGRLRKAVNKAIMALEKKLKAPAPKKKRKAKKAAA
jgi:hypothetical protein